MFTNKSKYNILFKAIAIALVCLCVFNDVSWSLQSDPGITTEQSTLAAQSRLKPFFETHGLEFQNMASVIMAAGTLKGLVIEKKMHEGPLYKQIEGFNRLFDNGSVEIEKQIGTAVLKSTGREYRYATFYFKKESQKVKVLFFEDHAGLTPAELAELDINDAEKYHLDCPGLEGVWFIADSLRAATVSVSTGAGQQAVTEPLSENGQAAAYTYTSPAKPASDEEVKQYIGSPEGRGKPRKEGPLLNTPIKRKALTRDGNLQEVELTLGNRLGSGLASVVYKGTYNGETIVEKFAGDLPVETRPKTLAKKLLEGLYFFFRQALPPYRTNFYAAMTNHYASLVIEEASKLEFGESIIPRILYTAYDEGSGGYVMAYDFMSGRRIIPGREERQLREYLGKCKSFIAYELGLWGLARQCDPKSLNSPGNVVVDEVTGKMRLIDITPGALGGQIWILPLETEYFFKGLVTDNFLPFGDAVDFSRFNAYREKVREELADDPARLKRFEDNCDNLEFYVNKWRESEPALLRSPLRIFHYLFKKTAMKPKLNTIITTLEYTGVISVEKANTLRSRVSRGDRHISLPSFKPWLILTFSAYISYKTLRFIIIKLPQIILVDILWKGLIKLKKAAVYTIKIYKDKEFRIKTANGYIEKAIAGAESDKRITPEEAGVLRDELAGEDIPELAALFPVWAAIDLITWSVFGIGIVPVFVDGILRCAVTVMFTGFKYKPLLALSVIPVVGTYIAIPTQLMKNSPHLTEFVMKEIIGSKIGTAFPGVSRDSFSEYLYMRLMNIPLFFLRFMAGLVNYFEQEESGQSYEAGIDGAIPVADIAVPSEPAKENEARQEAERPVQVTPPAASVKQEDPTPAQEKREDSPFFEAAKNESDRIHGKNLEYTPAISQKTILCHIVTDSILPESQRNTLKLLEKNMRKGDYNEKIVSFSVDDPADFIDELKALMARQREEYKDYTVEFDVACPSTDVVRAVLKSDLGVKALAFEAQKDAEINATIQLESIMLALRAMHSGKIENLRQAFKIVTGADLPQEMGSIEDIDNFAISILFVLPASKVLDYNENRRLNDIIRKNIETAA